MWIVLAAVLLASADASTAARPATLDLAAVARSARVDLSAVARSEKVDLSAVARSAKVDLSAVARSAKVDVTDRQTRVLALPEGRPLVIEVTIGEVRVEGWDKPEVEVTVERRVPSAAQLSRLPVSIAEVPPGVVVTALQTGDTADPALRSDVRVRLPRSARIERLQVVEGRIVIDGFDGAITGAIRRGPIDAKNISGTVRLSTEIGPVTLTNARLSANGLLRLRTFNGDVKLSLAQRPPDARIMALALNGSITSDIPLSLRESWGPRWGEATLGKGEPIISIDVVTGAVEIRSR